MSTDSPGPSAASAPDRSAETPLLTPEERSILRAVASDSIRHGLQFGEPSPVEIEGFPLPLQEHGAAFVTLEIDGSLRGCVGSLSATFPLVEDVARNAYSAAFLDHRFRPVSPVELPYLDIHISLLTPAVEMNVTSRKELLRALRPGVDGLILEDPPHRATFLPQVWEALPDPEDFLSELLLKAGLPADHWSPALRFRRYGVAEV